MADEAPQGGPLLPARLPPPLAHLPDPELAHPAARRPRAAPDRLLARLPGGARRARPPAAARARAGRDCRLAAPPRGAARSPPGRSRAGRSTAAARTARSPACRLAAAPAHDRRRAPLPARRAAVLAPIERRWRRRRPERRPLPARAPGRARPGCCCAIRSGRAGGGAARGRRRARAADRGGSALAATQRGETPLHAGITLESPRGARWSSSEAAPPLLLGQPRPAHPDRRLGGL